MSGMIDRLPDSDALHIRAFILTRRGSHAYQHTPGSLTIPKMACTKYFRGTHYLETTMGWIQTIRDGYIRCCTMCGAAIYGLRRPAVVRTGSRVLRPETRGR
jgi:hypothetical protein